MRQSPGIGELRAQRANRAKGDARPNDALAIKHTPSQGTSTYRSVWSRVWGLRRRYRGVRCRPWRRGRPRDRLHPEGNEGRLGANRPGGHVAGREEHRHDQVMPCRLSRTAASRPNTSSPPGRVRLTPARRDVEVPAAPTLPLAPPAKQTTVFAQLEPSLASYDGWP